MGIDAGFGVATDHRGAEESQDGQEGKQADHKTLQTWRNALNVNEANPTMRRAATKNCRDCERTSEARDPASAVFPDTARRLKTDEDGPEQSSNHQPKTNAL